MSKMGLGERFCDHDKSSPLPGIDKRQKMFQAPYVNFEPVYPDPTCAGRITISRLQDETRSEPFQLSTKRSAKNCHF